MQTTPITTRDFLGMMLVVSLGVFPITAALAAIGAPEIIEPIAVLLWSLRVANVVSGMGPRPGSPNRLEGMADAWKAFVLCVAYRP